MVQPSDRENKGDFVNDWKQKETSPPTEQNVRGGNQRYEEAASIQTAALFVLNSRPSRFPGDPRKAAREGGLFALDFADYLYISGFSMVSTFRN